MNKLIYILTTRIDWRLSASYMVFALIIAVLSFGYALIFFDFNTCLRLAGIVMACACMAYVIILAVVIYREWK